MVQVKINSNDPAFLKKSPSFANQPTGAPFYIVIYGSLQECIEKFMTFPAHTRHLYAIHVPKPDLPTLILTPEQIVEFARFKDFL